MASYIHGSAAPKPEQDWREEQLRRRRQQDIGKNVKKHHRSAETRNVPCTWICLTLFC